MSNQPQQQHYIKQTANSNILLSRHRSQLDLPTYSNLRKQDASNSNHQIVLIMADQVEELQLMLKSKQLDFLKMEKEHKKEKNELEDKLIRQTLLADFNENQRLDEVKRRKELERTVEILETKLKEYDRLIFKLPTLEEVENKEKDMNFLKLELNWHEKELAKLEYSSLKIKEIVDQKNETIKKLEENLVSANEDKDRAQLAFETYRKESQEVDRLMEKCQRLVVLEKKCEVNEQLISFLNQKIEHEIELVKALKIELAKSEESLKMMESKNHTLLEERINLVNKVNYLSALTSPETVTCLHSLFQEFNLCFKDMNELATLCIDLYHGKDIDVNTLLGFSKDVSYCLLLTESRKSEFSELINMAYLENQTMSIKNCRQELQEIREKLKDVFAKKIAEDMSCVTQ